MKNKQDYPNCINTKDSNSPTPDDVERVSKASADSDQTNKIRENEDNLEKETEIAEQQPDGPMRSCEIHLL